MHYARQLAVAENTPGINVEHHRCRGRVALAQKRRLFGDGQMNARAAHAVERRHSSCELGFKRAVIACLLHEA